MNEVGAKSACTNLIPEINISPAKAFTIPYSIKLIKMEGNTKNWSYMPLRKNNTDTVTSVWTDASPKEKVVWGFIGDGKSDKFEVSAQFEFENGFGNNIPIKVEALSETPGLVPDVQEGKFGESKNNVCRENASNITKQAIFTFKSFYIKGFFKYSYAIY